jgi:Fic family protein
MFPKISYEEYIWEPHFDLSAYDVWQRIQIEQPYKAAVLSPIADVQVEISKDIEDLYHAAIESIVRFDTEISEKMLVMPSILLRSESASSSQIEHLSASARNIAMAELGDTSKKNASLVAGNIRAMKKALEQTGDLTEEGLLAVHTALLEEVDPEIAGVFRDQQVWIGGRGISPHSADFVPPHHENVPAYIKDFLAFTNRKDIHGLLLASIAHCQFETIHPFIDGNGRTGRALIQIILHNAGLIRKSALPISAGLLSNLKGYFAALDAYRNGNYNAITEQMCKAALDAVDVSRKTAGKIEELRDTWTEKIKARSDAVVWRLLDLLLAQPVVDAKYVSENLGVTDPAARNAIDQLLSADILKSANNKSRGVLYEAPEVIKLTDLFAADLARRK